MTLAITPVFTPRGQIGQVFGSVIPASYSHAISARFGFESCSMTFPVSEDMGLYALNTLPGCAIAVYGPEAQIIWEGYCASVEATFGQEQRSLSLDDMANRVRMRYASVYGTPGASDIYNNTTSQGLYGIKTAIISGDAYNKAEANGVAQMYLNRSAFPMASPRTTVGTGDLGDVMITVIGAGWYDTLDWLMATNTSRNTVITTTQVQNLITAYTAENSHFSTNFANIVTSGVSRSEYIDPDTSYRTRLEALLQQGNSSYERFAWGVYENRQMKVAQWAGASPTKITYRRYLGEGLPTNSSGATIMPWDVRPDAMYEVVDLLDTSPVAGAADAAARFYVERVTCRVDSGGMSVDLEPTNVTGIDALLAQFAGRPKF